MAINIGGKLGKLPQPFKKRIQRISATRGFRFPTPYDPRTGHNVPLTPGPHVGLFTVLEEFEDHLVCEGYDPDKNKWLDEIFVAKPYVLQQTPFDGESVVYSDMTVSYAYTAIGKRTASATIDEEAVEENQRITPDYFADEELTCIRAAIQGHKDSGLVIDDVISVEWVDLNAAGRCWAEVVE
jgi:hypothetical protein